jgi:hypothetical protein
MMTSRQRNEDLQDTQVRPNLSLETIPEIHVSHPYAQASPVLLELTVHPWFEANVCLERE